MRPIFFSEEAKTMLAWIHSEKILKAQGVIGIHHANSVGDYIEVYTDESRTTVAQIFYGLRQQLGVGGKEYSPRTL